MAMKTFQRTKILQPSPSTMKYDESDQRWKAVERIVASPHFAKSRRLSEFLAYIVRCAVENRTEEITEQLIGINVFERGADFNPADDNIVRITARQLRQRLAIYYMEEGGADDIRIEVPRGGYFPVFHNVGIHGLDSEIVPPAPSALPDSPYIPEDAPIRSLPERRKRRVFFYAIALAIASVAIASVAIDRGVSILLLKASATDPLWREIFSPTQTTMYVPGDAGLNMFHNRAHFPRQMELKEYIGRKFLNLPEAKSPEFAGGPLAGRHYTDITSLQLANCLTELARFQRRNYQIKFPRDLESGDFRNANIILSGSPVFNPWVELFDSHLNFHIVYNNSDGANTLFIENRKPAAGEPSIFYADGSQGFGYIALTDNLDDNGKVLLIEGTSSPGVDAAIKFLFNDKKMAPIIAKANSGRRAPANFEVLLKATLLNSSSGEEQVIATRYYPRSNNGAFDNQGRSTFTDSAPHDH